MTLRAKKVKTSLSIDGDLMDQIRAEAKLERRPMSQLVEIWLEEALAVHQSLKADKPQE